MLSSSPDGLQCSLNTLENYCVNWKLEINTSKSKILVFNSNGKTFLNHFTINGICIETVDKYCYLGINLKCNGKFNLAAARLVDKARKALFKVKKSLGLHHSCQLLEKLFDTMIIPILLYGSEVWGIDLVIKNSGSASYEKFHVKFLKQILGVHCKTSNNACYSELG